MRMWIGLALSMAAVQAAAQSVSPVALVEDVSGAAAGVEVMDYVRPGQVIRLGPADTLQLSYMQSCRRESIRGGTVTVGTDKSEVAGGTITPEQVRCDAGKLRLTGAQAQQSGAVVFRRAPEQTGRRTLPTPEITLHGTAPILRVAGGGPVTIARLDAEEPKVELQLPPSTGKAALRDLAAEGRNLSAGAIYELSAGSQRLVFRIDPAAQPGKTPAVGRLLQLGGN